MKIGYDTKNDEGWAMDAACARPRRVRPFRTVCRLGLAAALLALVGMSGDRSAWGAANWTVGQRAVMAAALKSTVPPELALAVAQVGREERLRGEGAPGAVGVMQVLPSLAREELGVRAYGLEDTRANAGVGLTLLERLNRRYEGRWDLTLSHYRGGPLVRCKEGPVMHDGALKYVAAVMDWWVRYQKDTDMPALMEEARRGGFTDSGVSSRADTYWRRAGPNSRDHGWRPFQEQRRSARRDWCNESARGQGQFRSDDAPACEGARSQRFF